MTKTNRYGERVTITYVWEKKGNYVLTSGADNQIATMKSDGYHYVAKVEDYAKADKVVKKLKKKRKNSKSS